MPQYYGYGQTAPPLSDTRVDRLADIDSGVIDDVPALSIDIPDREIIRNLEDRIQDSQGYWNDPSGFDLYNVRQANSKLYLGKQLDVRSLYRFQVPYIENQIYVSEQSIKSYLTSDTAQPEVTPSSDKPQAKQFAQDAEKILLSHGTNRKVRLAEKLENMVKNALDQRGGIMYFCFDPNVGKNGEIIPMALSPGDVIVDKNARQGENPAFIARALKMTVNEAVARWPNMRKEIFAEAGIVYNTAKNRDVVLDIREVWVTYFDKSFQPHEAVVYYCGDVVLEKDRNPHWIYVTESKNYLDEPFKPFIPLNFDNDGQHWIDATSAIEQAAHLQMVLNKRGRQFMEVVDKANGILVVDTRVSGITKADAQDLTRDPNQTIVIDSPGGSDGKNGIFELEPAQIPNDIFQDKVDIRTQIHAMMGTPNDFTGTNDPAADPDTLGQSLLKKDQASGRQDLYARAIERFMAEYYNMLYHLMGVWYDDKRQFQYSGGDGEFDFLNISRDILDTDVSIGVRSGIFDKQRVEAITMALVQKEAIALLDVFKLLHLPNPQKLYDNWAKQKTDPMALARDTMEDVEDAKAYMAYEEIMAGKPPTNDPDDCDREFILTLRKIMLSDDFLKHKNRKHKLAFLKYYDEALKSLELRTSLDIMSREGVQLLERNQPVQPLPPPQQPGLGMPPGMPGQQGGIMPPNPGAVPTPSPGLASQSPQIPNIPQPVPALPPQPAPPVQPVLSNLTPQL
jgi:hypothetical protein